MYKSIATLAFIASLAWGETGSSVKIPEPVHNLAVFGNHKHHPVQKMRIDQTLQRLAPLGADEVKAKLSEQGWQIERLSLEDVDSNLLYVGSAEAADDKRYRLFIDPASGAIVRREEWL